ncbi:hypothetical protein IQ250_28450 [Pseudanabaenaceae cyanobacterium LEGE 13415]|nr:hypothetical protein [Pseudanabaenaceae cyanobacterium LEGE 13415]
MLQAHRFYIKTADINRRRFLVGGDEMHSDCEAVLLSGSEQVDVWGASWIPSTQEIFYESMVNLRPRQNRSMQILDSAIREQVQVIINRLWGDV